MSRNGKPGTGVRHPRLDQGIPVTRGEHFLGLQMAFTLKEAGRKSRRAKADAAPAESPPGEGAGRTKEFAPLLCPRCGRYLVTGLAGTSALCPRCGVWAVNG
jgi:membrane protease subunit (stomatin/prohibitin family)